MSGVPDQIWNMDGTNGVKLAHGGLNYVLLAHEMNAGVLYEQAQHW